MRIIADVSATQGNQKACCIDYNVECKLIFYLKNNFDFPL